LLTAALLTIVYVWLSKICTPGISLLLTVTGAFGTMFWPYAYIGLETKQSLFVLLAGYMALANGKIRGWPRLILFAIVCALAITTKSTGIVLAPAIAFLVYVQFRDDWRARWRQPSGVLLVIGTVWVLSTLGWNYFWGPRGGGAHALQAWTTDSVLQMFSNVIGIFGSPNKGVFIFAPVLLLSIYAVPRAFREHREIVIFGVLVTACTVAFLSILFLTADEVWGPRFMHVAIAPLLLVIGVAWPKFKWRTHLPLLALGAFGLAISFLGAFYYYGGRGTASDATGQNTLEWLAGDSVWNEIVFDARLFSVWVKGGKDPVLWTPSHVWAWTPPAGAQPWKSINLRDYADPQSFLLYYWKVPLDGSAQVIFRICWISLLLGPVLLIWVVARTINIRAAVPLPVPVLPLKGRKASRTS
jgi:multisubunit Na+/H+ antiporter MnhB subunit